MEIVVFGAGSLGSLIGGVLARAHDVTLVGRPDHVAAIRSDGLRVTGKLECHVRPSATTNGRNLAADLAVLTVKAADTPAAAEALSTGTFDAALSLQNGMGNEAILADALESPVLAGTATYGAIRREPGVVDCTGLGEIVLGPPGGGHSRLAARIGDAFREADLGTTVADDMPRRLWEKLAVNAAINPITALADVDNGAVLDPPAIEIAVSSARETARVARTSGVHLADDVAVDAVTRVARDTAANTSSMRQDVRAGRPTEIDAINGYVVDRADELDLDVPTNRLLTSLVRTWERGKTFGK